MGLSVRPINWKMDWPLQCEKPEATFSCKRINQCSKENLWLLISYCWAQGEEFCFCESRFEPSSCSRPTTPVSLCQQQTFGRKTRCPIAWVLWQWLVNKLTPCIRLVAVLFFIFYSCHNYRPTVFFFQLDSSLWRIIVLVWRPFLCFLTEDKYSVYQCHVQMSGSWLW